jgi:hypothetical protein
MDMEALMNHELFVPLTWQHVVAIGTIALCAGNTVWAEPGVTPEQKFPTGYLESVATGYENGQATQAQATDKTRATATPGTVAPTSFVSEPEAPSVLPKEKVKKTSK